MPRADCGTCSSAWLLEGGSDSGGGKTTQSFYLGRLSSYPAVFPDPVLVCVSLPAKAGTIEMMTTRCARAAAETNADQSVSKSRCVRPYTVLHCVH